MQRQFIPTPSHRGNGYRPEPNPPSVERPTADSQRDIPPAQPQVPYVTPTGSTRPPGTGLLSNWKANAARSSGLIGNTGLQALTEQKTLEHEAVPLPVTGPSHYPANTATNYYGPQSYSASPPAMSIPQSTQTMGPAQHTTGTPQPGYGPYSQLQPLMPIPGATQPVSHQYSPWPAIPSPMYRGPAPQSLRPAPRWKRKKRESKGMRIVLCMMLIPLLAVGGFAAYYYYSLSSPISSILGQQVQRLPGDEDPNQLRGSGGSVLTGGRINILLLGSDTDVKFTNADGSHTYLAQTDIVVSVDPSTSDVTMFSIPRDFWVNVPGFGMHKLDEAYALGGVALSRLTIYQDFGIHINYYAWVGLDGFVKVIDTVGGIDIDVIHPITDDQYPDDVGNNTQDIYRYKRLYLTPGPQHLGGIEALEYVRSRHADLVGDFGRSARQQQVLKQLKNKLNNPGVVEKFQELANDLKGYVKTDMQLTDVFNLLRFARGIDTGKIKQITLGPPYSNDGLTASKKSVVFPHCDMIVPVIVKVFGSTADARCNVTDPNAPPTPPSTPTPAATATPTSWVSPASSALSQTSGDSVMQIAGQMVNVSAMSLNGGSSIDLLGIHSLLDLLLLIVFESPDALQV